MRLGLGDSIFDDTIAATASANIPLPAVQTVAMPTVEVATDYMQYLPYVAALGIVWYLTQK